MLTVVTHHNWLPAFTWQCLHLHEQGGNENLQVATLDSVPVMLATVLGLELLLQESSIDLNMASALVLSDVGATIKILRLIGNDYVMAGDRPKRMYECLASLDVRTWFGAVSAYTVGCDQENSATIALWKHSQSIAECAKQVAKLLPEVSPEDAYLVGLLHEIRAIPTVLGWEGVLWDTKTKCRAFPMEGSLPLFVLAALRCVKKAHPLSTWRFILSEAHALANEESDLLAMALTHPGDAGKPPSSFLRGRFCCPELQL